MTAQRDTDREAFERWMIDQGYGGMPRVCSEGSPCAGEYSNQYWHRSYVAWAAAIDHERARVLALIAATPSAASEAQSGEDETIDAEFELHATMPSGEETYIAASASGRRVDALREIANYAVQYDDEGPLEVYEIVRTRIDIDAAISRAASPAHGGA